MKIKTTHIVLETTIFAPDDGEKNSVGIEKIRKVYELDDAGHRGGGGNYGTLVLETGDGILKVIRLEDFEKMDLDMFKSLHK